MVPWRHTRPTRTNTKSDVLFIIGNWNAKVDSQEIPGATGTFGLGVKLSREKANRVLPKECTGQSKHPLPTTHETTLHMDIARWSIPKSDCLYSLQQRWSSIQSAKTGQGADWIRSWVQFSSVSQSCPKICDRMNCSTPGLPVHHQLLEFTQTHVHRVSDAIQPSHPLASPSPPAPNPSQLQSLFQWVNSSHEVAKVLEFQL